MKRIYACLGIVAALLAVAFYSSFRVQMFAEDISGDIDHAMEAIREDDLTGARQALAEGADLCDRMREGMNTCSKRKTSPNWKRPSAPPTAIWNGTPPKKRSGSCAALRSRSKRWPGLPGASSEAIQHFA